MAYDVTAMTAHFKILIRDPGGNSLTDTQIRDDYLNPAYQDWWRRHERRRSSIASSVNPGERQVSVASANLFNPNVLEVAIIDPTGGQINLAVKRSEWNRVRWLQETEHRIGMPRQWAWNASVSGGVPDNQVAFYPLADQYYDFFVRWTGPPTALTTGTQTVLIDPVSARYVTRLAAYRAAIDLKLSDRLLSTIAAPARAWIEVLSNMRYNIEQKTLPRDQARDAKRMQAAGI